MNNTEQLHQQARVIHKKIAIALDFYRSKNLELPDLTRYYEELNNLYDEDFALCQLLDKSDIVIHAQGEALHSHSADFGKVSNLIRVVGTQIKGLAVASILKEIDNIEEWLKKLNLRLTGTAPGSFYAGYTLQQPKRSAIGGDEESSFFISLKESMLNITKLPPDFDKKSSSFLELMSELIEDPIARDSTLLAAFHLSKLGKGIDSVDIINPKEIGNQSSCIKRTQQKFLKTFTEDTPLLRNKTKTATFVGNFKKVDLDSTRVDLRNVETDGINKLRCIIKGLSAEKAKTLLNEKVEVTGEYEENISGKPRLIKVDINNCKILGTAQKHLD